MKGTLFFKILVGVLVFSGVLIPLASWAYSSETTHSLLTKEIIDLYNQNSSDNEITENDAWWLMRGSVFEDEPLSRTINHFLDPISGRGLNGKGSDWLSPAIATLKPFIVPSKQWANDALVQSTFLGEAYKNNSLNPYAQLTENPIESISAHTWDKAIYLYIKGEREKAFESLGHILHLLEDLAVPAHTRNDPHLFGDSYEKWASRFEPGSLKVSSQLINFSPKIFFSLEEYFDSMANYTNHNFFSSDTIGLLKYNNPQMEFLNTINFDGYKYIYDEDEFGRYFLVRLGKYNLGVFSLDITVNDERVHQDYWSHLSRQTVLHGAGLLNLFFKEVDRYKNNSEFIKRNQETTFSKLKESLASILANLSKNLSKEDVLEEVQAKPEEILKETERENNDLQVEDKENDKNSFSDSDDFMGEEVFIDFSKSQFKATPTPQPDSTSSPQASPQPEADPPLAETPTPDGSEQTPVPLDSSPTPIEMSLPPVNWCDQNNPNGIKNSKSIVINEIAWMGNSNSSADEWIELKNISLVSVDISQWQLIDKAGQIKISFGREGSTVIFPGGFFLLERTDDNSVPNTQADLIFTGGINNSNEFLKLMSSDCKLIDSVVADPNWSAGNSGERRSMERGLGSNWHTYSGSSNFGILGTPRVENSIPSNPSPTPIIGGGYSNPQPDSTSSPQASPSPTPQVEPDDPPSPSFVSQAGSILISEFLFDAEGSDDGWEFVELYNPTSDSINLDGGVLRLKKGDDISTLVNFGSKSDDATIIGGRSFLLIGLNGYNAGNYEGTSADITRSASLGQSEEYSYTIELVDSEENIIDQALYLSGDISAGQSLERKASSSSNSETMKIGGREEREGNSYDTDNKTNFISRDLPQPQNSISSSEPQEVPPKILNISGKRRESDDMPIISFSLGGSIANNTDFVFKYSTNEIDSENNWNNLTKIEDLNFNETESGKWEVELNAMSPRKYYLIAKTIDSWGQESEISDIYVFDLPPCTPRLGNSGHPYVKNISFYSCLGRNWIDFEFADFLDPLPVEVRNIGIYFFKNKTENQICHNNEECFQEFNLPRADALGVIGWGGISIGNHQNKSISSVFIGADNNNISDLDFNLSRGQNFSFPIAGFFDNSGQLQNSFSEADYISPVFLSWSGNNPWWKRLGGGAEDIVKFQSIPRSSPVLGAENFQADYDKTTKKFIFDFNIKEIKSNLRYEIRYLTSGVNELNWDTATEISSGKLDKVGENQVLANASGLPSEKDYYFGLKLKSGNDYSSIVRSQSFIPVSPLNCLDYSSDLICDNFNNYDTNSNLSGQNNWRGSGKFKVAPNLGRQDSQALLAQSQNDTIRISKSFAIPSEKGSLSLWVKRKQDRSFPSVSINSGGIAKAFMEPFDDHIYLVDSGAKVAYQHSMFGAGGYQKWYFKWDKTANKYWFKVGDLDWQEMGWSSPTDVHGITLQAGGYHDSIFEDIKPEVF